MTSEMRIAASDDDLVAAFARLLRAYAHRWIDGGSQADEMPAEPFVDAGPADVRVLPAEGALTIRWIYRGVYVGSGGRAVAREVVVPVVATVMLDGPRPRVDVAFERDDLLRQIRPVQKD